VISHSISLQSLAFGSSPEYSHILASKVKVPVPFSDGLSVAKGYIDGKRPLELVNIPTVVMNRGILADVYAKQLPDSFPLTFKSREFNCSILYQVKGEGPMLHAADAIFDRMDISPGKPITMRVLIVPDLRPNSVLESLDEAILFFLNGTDYAQNARLGYLTIYGSKGHPFDIMSEAYMQAPDLYVWKPVTLSIKPSNPVRKDGFELIPLDFALLFPNTGPLHLDIGQFKISIMNQNRELLNIGNEGPMIVKNVLEGADRPDVLNPINGVFKAMLPWSDFNPISFFKHLLDSLNVFKYHFEVNVIRPGEGNIWWINAMAKHIVRLPEIKALIPVILGLIKRIHWKIFGISLNHRRMLPGMDEDGLDETDQLIARYNTSSFRILVLDD
jgi:hypothetical protein